MLKIGVLIKQVPDTETKIRMGPDASDIVRDGIKYVMNPYDEFAVEQGLKLKEQIGGDASVTAVSLGQDRVTEVLRTALAMGADRALHLKDEVFQGQDQLATARALSAAIKSEDFGIVFAGKMAIDDNASVVATAVAELLQWPRVNLVHAFEYSDAGVTCRRRIDGGEEVVECQLPALFTCEKGLNEPRYASLTGIMKAKKKPIEVKSAADLGLSAEQVGKSGSGSVRTRLMSLPERGECQFIEGDAAESAEKLVQILRNEAKVI